MESENFSGPALSKHIAELIFKYARIRVSTWQKHLTLELGKKHSANALKYLRTAIEKYSLDKDKLPTNYEVTSYLFDGSNFMVIDENNVLEFGFEYIPGDFQKAVELAHQNIDKILATLQQEINKHPEQAHNLQTDKYINKHSTPTATESTKKQTTLLRIEEAISEYSISRTTLYQWRKSGALPYKRIGRMVYVHRDDIEKLLST